MWKGKCSSISKTFTSLFLVSTIFAFSFFVFFLFLQPQHNIIHALNYNKLFNTTTNDIPIHTSLVDEDEVRKDGALTTNGTITPTSIDEDEDHKDDALTTNDIVNTSIEEDEDHQDDLFRSPPVNVSRKERIAWFMENLPRFRAIKSTPVTRQFDQRINEFFGQNCTVKFFMTWISPASQFGPREILSMESALKSHGNGCMVIVSKTMDSKLGQKILTPLLNRGIKIIALAPDFPTLFSQTPAQFWLEGLTTGKIDPGKIAITQNLSNLLRLVVLYKYGGVYLDADVIIIKDISNLRNSIGAQSVEVGTKQWRYLNNAVLIFDKGHPLLLRFIAEFAFTFNGNLWGYNGPLLVSRVAKQVANDSNYKFNALPPMAFYPVDWVRIGGLFKKPVDKAHAKWVRDKFRQLSNDAYGIHLWNKFSKKLRIEEESVIGRLISSHCIVCQHIYEF